ncbi:MAG: ATP-dependent helicase C-terminal domain-containing protein [Candidatus Sericytochromatia bacterium]|nr:ATP-dependent helicase C-terminal domain-containing protein [Candidatus Sericytochromatia bacterium]
MSDTLPVEAWLETITNQLLAHRRLVLAAPPGTGKSTLVPARLMRLGYRVTVLQPRRVAARMLAARVSGNSPLGGEVGYAVRHDRKAGPDTRLLFVTAGVFLQELLQGGPEPCPDILVLDEWHERSLEGDMAAAWALQQVKGPMILAMSATLDVRETARWLNDAPILEVPGVTHPVALRHQVPRTREPLGDQVARAFLDLRSEGLDGSVLVFLPGKGEIEQVAERMSLPAREAGVSLHRLHGGLSLEAQREALEAPIGNRAIVLATNVAETSLTLPGVTVVIDSGKARRIDAASQGQPRALRLGWITRANAVQRMGRAGRIAPGRCVRLWDPAFTSSMDERPLPGILTEDPLRTVLWSLALGLGRHLPTPLPESVRQEAVERLRLLGGVDGDGRLTPLGRRMVRLPLGPEAAAVAAGNPEGPWARLVVASAVLREEDGGHPGGDLAQDAWELLRRGPGGGEHARTFVQIARLLRLPREDGPWLREGHPPEEARRALADAWRTCLPHALAIRADRAHRHASDERALLPEAAPSLLLVVRRQPVEGPGQKLTRGDLWLEVREAWWQDATTTRTLTRWDDKQGRVLQEREVQLDGLVLRRAPLPPSSWQPEAVQETLAAAILEQGLRVPALDDEDFVQWLRRIRAAVLHAPGEGWPDLEADWPLVIHEACSGMKRPTDLTAGPVRRVLDELMGPWLVQRLQRLAPSRWPLPGGRWGRVTLDEDGRAELSARLGDLVGLTGPQAIFDGKLPMRFDILAPNMRTVQKTDDLEGFWRGAYLEVKRELKRRYPKHPWP